MKTPYESSADNTGPNEGLVPSIDVRLHEAARHAASNGFPVLPLRGKTPLTTHGCKDASTDLNQIDDWWAQRPGANLGIATGYVADVLDVDGPAGLASLDQWEAEHGKLPKTYTVRTGGGGLHYYFRPIEGASNRTGMLPGLDYRAKGGYVVAAGSIHPSGTRYGSRTTLRLLNRQWLWSIPSSRRGPSAGLRPVNQLIPRVLKQKRTGRRRFATSASLLPGQIMLVAGTLRSSTRRAT